MWENIEILNFTKQKGAITLYQNQVIILQSFSGIFISNGNEKAEILVNKPVYLGLSIVKFSKY